MNKADLRPLVLEALRQSPATQFDGVASAVARLAAEHTRQDDFTIREIVWELLVQGVLAPGLNQSNLDFPFIHVTEYGERCLAADTILPHDPDGYMERLQQHVVEPLDDIIETYVRESLLTFVAGHYLAATVMLGVASERCVDLLTTACLDAIADAGDKSTFERAVERSGRSVKRRFDTLRAKLLALRLPPELGDALDIQLSGIFTLIRYSRNEAGHPSGQVVDRDTAYANLLMFPQYCKRVYGLIDYLQANPI